MVASILVNYVIEYVAAQLVIGVPTFAVLSFISYCSDQLDVAFLNVVTADYVVSILLVAALVYADFEVVVSVVADFHLCGKTYQLPQMFML